MFLQYIIINHQKHFIILFINREKNFCIYVYINYLDYKKAFLSNRMYILNSSMTRFVMDINNYHVTNK